VHSAKGYRREESAPRSENLGLTVRKRQRCALTAMPRDQSWRRDDLLGRLVSCWHQQTREIILGLNDNRYNEALFEWNKKITYI